MDTSCLQQYIELLKTMDHVLQKLIPAELQKEEAFFLMNNHCTIFDTEYRYLYVPPYYARLLGFTPEELNGKHWSDLGLSATLMSGMEKAVRTVTETKQKLQIEYKDNEASPTQYFRRIFFPFCESGEVVAVGQFTVDTSTQKMTEEHLRISMEEQHQSEEALWRSEEKFDKAFYANPSPMTITAASDGRYIDVNAAFADLVGYSREELRMKVPNQIFG